MYITFPFLSMSQSLVISGFVIHVTYANSPLPGAFVHLVNLPMREPLAWLEILLFKRGIKDTQAPYFACRRRVVALDVGFGLAVGGLQGEGAGGLEEIRALAMVLFFVGRGLCWRGEKGGLKAPGGEEGNAPPSCGEGTRSSLQGRGRILLCQSRLRRWCWWYSRRGLLARRGSSGMGLCEGWLVGVCEGGD